MSGGTCRYCKSMWEPGTGYGAVKYGIRHYAHITCAVERNGVEWLRKLPRWTLSTLNWLQIKALPESGKAIVRERLS